MKKISNLLLGVILYISLIILFIYIPLSRSSIKGKEDLYPIDTPLLVKPDKADLTGQKILFIGDSHTCYDGGWQDQLCKLTGMVGTRIAKGGMQTSWMWKNSKNRIDSTFDWCVIWGGANDAASPLKSDSTIKNIQRIVDLCNSKGVKCIVLTGFNPDVIKITEYNEKQWGFYPAKYHKLQTKMKTEIKNAIVVKNWFVNRQDGDCGDFICHLSARGHRKMAIGIYNEVFK